MGHTFVFKYITQQKPYILAYVYDLDEYYSYAKNIYIWCNFILSESNKITLFFSKEKK